MNFIKKLQSKNNALKWVVENVIPKDIRTLIFCSLIEQANEICQHRYHSKTGKEDFIAFKNEEISQMACVDAINEGHNIPNIDCGVIGYLNSNSLDFVQRLGRIVRYRPGHIGKIVIVCVADSVDKDWVLKATRKVNMAKVTWVEFSRLQAGTETINF
jgi:superfamily II DNA or RNA helicase